MVYKKSISRIVFQFFNYLFLTLLIICCLYPMLYVLFASLSEPSKLMVYKGMLVKPLGFTLDAYIKAFQHPLLLTSYKNTLFVLFAGLAVNLVLTSIGAYFLSRKDVMLQKYIAMGIIFTMFFGGGLIPFYLIVKGVGLYNSLWSLILPTAVSTFNLMVMRTGFAGIPDSLEEAAKIDGAGHITILFRIVLPLSKSILAVMALYYGVGYWNAWFNASIFIREQTKFPLQLILRQILLINSNSVLADVSAADQEKIGETIKYATIIIATLPILLMYPFVQRYFVKGVMVGSIKG